jgi:uncharacterized protein YlaI
MLYTRSSFITYLTKVHDCEIVVLDDSKGKALQVKNGPAKAYIMVNSRNRIDYKEIFIVCKKLYLPIPLNADLEKIED